MKRPFFLLFFIILGINFFLPRLMPGGPFASDALENSTTASTFTEAQMEKYKAYYGMDLPVIRQFSLYLQQLAQGNLGYSIHQNKEVMDVLAERLPWTLSIVAISLVLSAAIGIMLGALSSWRQRTKTDSLLFLTMNTLNEIPAFAIGTILLFVLAANLGLFPLAGGMTPFASYTSAPEKWWDLLYHAILPILTLTLTRVGQFYVITRSSLLTIATKDYIRTAIGKGLPTLTITLHYLLKNAAPPILARFFMSFGTMIGGAILVENIFSYPGVGELIISAIFARDYVLIQGIFFVLTIIILSTSAIADYCYRKIDASIGSGDLK